MEKPLVLNKIVKTWGKSKVVVFNKEDLKILNLKNGDIMILQINEIKRKTNGV